MYADAKTWVFLCSVILVSHLCLPVSLGSGIPKDLGAWRLHWYVGEVSITVDSDENEEHRVFGKSLGLVVPIWTKSVGGEDRRCEVRMHFVYVPIHLIDKARKLGLANLTGEAIQELISCPGPRDDDLRLFGAVFRKRRVTEFPSVQSKVEPDAPKAGPGPIAHQYWSGTFLSPGVVAWMGQENRICTPVYNMAGRFLQNMVFEKQLSEVNATKVVRVAARTSLTCRRSDGSTKYHQSLAFAGTGPYLDAHDLPTVWRTSFFDRWTRPNGKLLLLVDMRGSLVLINLPQEAAIAVLEKGDIAQAENFFH